MRSINKMSRKKIAWISILIVGFLPSICAAIFINGTHGDKYNFATAFQLVLAGLFAIFLFFDELPRQEKITKKKSPKNIIFALVYALMMAFIGAAISGVLALAVLGPDSF
jgi:membrane protease YdiL (CAAX protease family)